MSLIGDRIKEIRESKGLSQNQLAKISRVSQATLSAVERDLQYPNMQTVELIAKAFDVPVSHLLGSQSKDDAKKIGSRIRKTREGKQMTMETLASAANVTVSFLRELENNQLPASYDTISSISRALDVSMDDILSPYDESALLHISTRSYRIPVLGRIPAGVPIEAVEDILDWEDINPKWVSEGVEYFGLKIVGDSMYPKYMDGDIIIVRRQDTVNSGEDAVVMVNGNDATFKKVLINDNGIVLQPLNHEYEPMFFTKKDIEELPVSILGICKEIRRKP